MSAAEKLKALERVSRDLRFHPENVREAREDIIRALPQIVAVVQAAETNLVIYDAALIAAGMNTTPNKMLAAALSALDEALS